MLKTLIAEVLNDIGHFGQKIDRFATIYNFGFGENKFRLNLTISVKDSLQQSLENVLNGVLEVLTSVPISVAVLENIPPILAVARAIVTAVIELLTIALRNISYNISV